ncbi:MAG: tetratricopeptide repeat protein, partial [Gemmatimonadales bacterium]
ELRYTTGIWRYARALALTGKARFPEARVEQDSLLAIIAATSPEQIVNFNSAKTMLQLAERHLAGRMAVAHADLPAAVAAYQEAMALEDGLVYEEPPAWYVPIREELGRTYFEAGQYAESEKAFRDDLTYWRDNPWSMRGLARSLRRQGKNPEAAELEKKLAKETPG